MSWFNATQVDITNGSTVVTVASGESIVNIQAEDGLIIGANSPVEIKRSYVGSGGEQFIELTLPWTESTQVNAVARSYATGGDFASATAALRNATLVTSDNFKVLEDFTSLAAGVANPNGTGTAGTVTFKNQAGTSNEIRSLASMDADVKVVETLANSIVGNIKAMGKAEFFSQAASEIANEAGSGFLEMGNDGGATTGDYAKINEGMWTNSTISSLLYIGQNKDAGTVAGISRTPYAIAQVNGVLHNFTGLGNSNEQAIVRFPDAPDGLDKSDGTGRFSDIAAAVVAGGNSLTASVISRKDFVFLESWHEDIAKLDVVFPLGNVQYGSSTWEGITLDTLDTLTIARDYAAFGEWNTQLINSYGKRWSTLSEDDKTKFLQDPVNNIYSDDGKLIQVRYRIRVIKGLGDQWYKTSPLDLIVSDIMMYSNNHRPKVRGSSTTFSDYTATTDCFADNDLDPIITLGKGLWGARGNISNADKAHDGLCFAIPIALVQRRNKGAFDKTFNPSGTTVLWNKDDVTAATYHWYSPNAKRPTSLSNCMSLGNPNSASVYGNSGQGSIGKFTRPDGKFYDAIEAGDVDDLRMYSVRKPKLEIYNKYSAMAKAAKIRGYEGVPFTTFNLATLSGPNAVLTTVSNNNSSVQFNISGVVGDIVWIQQNEGDYLKYTNVSGGSLDNIVVNGSEQAGGRGVDRFDNQMIILETKQFHRQVEPTWTDIVGDPVNILATFPNGVEGKWNNDTAGGVITATRKVLSATNRIYTDNVGISWASSTLTLDTTNNTISTYHDSVPARVTLVPYKTQAHFTEDAVNEKVEHTGHCTSISRHNAELGCVLGSSLIGKVMTNNTTDGRPTNKTIGDYSIADGLLRTDVPLEHTAIVIGSNGNGVALKLFDKLVNEGGLANIHFHYKEMMFDVNKDSYNDATSILSTAVQSPWVLGGLYYVTDEDVVIRSNISISGTSFSQYRKISDDRWVDSGGGVPFELWDGDGFGDDNKIQIISSGQESFTDDNNNTGVRGTAKLRRGAVQYFLTED